MKENLPDDGKTMAYLDTIKPLIDQITCALRKMD